jgi:hypothetical protein
MKKSKPSILFYDIGNYSMYVREDGSVSIISKHSRNEGRELSQWFTKDGYLRTKLNSKTRTIHSIVAEVHYGPRPEGLVINHKDGNKLNNHPSNLEYCTLKENIAHAIRSGLHITCTPEKLSTFKDGRTRNRRQYKKDWYESNKVRLKSEHKMGWNYDY